MGPKERLSQEDIKIVRQANLLLEQLNAGSSLSCVEDINAAVYVTLFEGLCGEKLQGVIQKPVSREDEIQNVQLVIDILSRDILHTSLAHITGRDAIDGNRESILNLLEIFGGLLEYILNKIESDVSTDGEGDPDELDEDPDAVQPEVIDKILERELQRNYSLEGSPERLTPKGSPARRSPIKSPKSELRRKALLSPSKPSKISGPSLKKTLSETEDLIAAVNDTSTGCKETTVSTDQNSTNELIKEGENLEKDLLSDRYRPGKTAAQIREDLARHRRDLGLPKDPFSDLVPVTEIDDKKQSNMKTSNSKDTESYENLRNLVEETAAMAEEALYCSPNQARTILRSMENDYNTGKLTRTYPSPKKDQYGSPPRKTKSPTRVSEDEFFSDSELTPSRAKRKVSFMVERSTTSDSSPSFLRTAPRYKPKTKSAWTEKKEGSKKPTRPRQDNTQRRGISGDSSLFDFEKNPANFSYDDYLKKQFHEIIDDVLSEDEAMPARFRSRNDQQKIHSSRLGSKSKGNYSISDTQRLLNKEKDVNKRKVDFLQRIYREDLDELQNEAEYGLSKDRKDAKQVEDVYKKKVLTGPKASVKPKEPGMKKKMPVHKPSVCSKAKRKSPSGTTALPKQKMTIKDDEDILPLLLKEFPHLHLSLHTWHELWRKGIHQIEQVTRANQEVRRKKSKAKAELEEAEKRHEIMVNIMKKELEHGQRMKEIKERQKQTVAAKNLIQEKRAQSARSRKYYDDYQVRMRSKMLKRRTREEMIFRKLFKDGLDIQKDRVRELKKYAQEQRDSQASAQRNEIESMENYYRDQFEMLAESITKERKEILIREKAQQKVLEQMKKELRKKMESEIHLLQDQFVRDDDDAYFRQLDADRVIHNLQLAKYHVNV
ncbi:centrosomal protein of 95 kDa-like [Saccostrea echinata]|uniref:centrosomal protein of 95 kDa-like n=1 Tax=Saccostrea echinata TaxID=191078 RepID=UPI002A7F0FDF|nr:centrosomal protein of 95 kDa-like [Saccostrea echinata]